MAAPDLAAGHADKFHTYLYAMSRHADKPIRTLMLRQGKRTNPNVP